MGVISIIEDPSFITNVATAASISATAFRSISKPYSYPTAVTTPAGTVVYTGTHTHAAPVEETTTVVEGVDEAWKSAAIAMTVVSIILFIIVLSLAFGGKKGRSGGSSGAVKAAG